MTNLEEMATTVAAATTLGGALLWVFREKLAAWVVGQTQSARDKLESRVAVLEKNHSNHESELMRVAEAMERTSENMNDSMRRLTMSMERIADKHEETSHAVARIEGALERRHEPRR